MRHVTYQTLVDICSARESVNVFRTLQKREAWVINEPPYQIIELIGIQGWRLVWRNVRFDIRTRVHICILVPRQKDDSGMREFHPVSVKAEKRMPGAEFGALTMMRGRVEKRSDKMPIWSKSLTCHKGI
jgi:hypothetical protein